MPATQKRTERGASPDAQFETFLRRYTPDIAANAHEILEKLRGQVPGAIELVYDNYNALAIGFSPSERASEAIVSVAVYPKWVSVFFLQGVGLPDPEKLLQGSGNKVRHIVVRDPALVDEPAVRALIRAALEHAQRRIDPAGERRMVIKSVSEKQRPRRPAAAPRKPRATA